MAVTAQRIVVPQRMMLRGSVIPKCDRPGLPFEAAVETRILDVPVQHFEQRIAFSALQLWDLGREPAIHIQRFTPGYGMRAHHRMFRARELQRTSLAAVALVIDDICVRTVMERG